MIRFVEPMSFPVELARPAFGPPPFGIGRVDSAKRRSVARRLATGWNPNSASQRGYSAASPETIA
jgi:hypothetical protein